MTKQELNRDVKRLLKKVILLRSTVEASNSPFLDAFYEQINGDVKKEFLRLYYADKDFQAMTKINVLTMLHLNLSYRYVALHQFGIDIGTDSLK